MNNEKKLTEFLEKNNGYITTAELVELNIYKSQIQFYIDKGIIEKVSHGLYMSTKIFKDEYYILQKNYPSAIFSYNTESHYEIGIITVTSPLGNLVKVYNAERCICDMLKSEKEFDLELQNRVLDYYFSSKYKNVELLLEYAKIFNIYEKVNTIVEVMMKW